MPEDNLGAVSTSGNEGVTAPVTTGTDNATPAAEAIPAPRPASFQEALQKASAAADSSSATPQASIDPKTGKPPVVTAPETKPQVGADGKPVAQPQDDPTKDAAWMGIPEARRNTILQNARKDEREKVVEEFWQEYGWAAKLDGEQVTAMAGLVDRLNQNPVKFVTDLIAEIRAVPQLAPVLAQALGQLGSGEVVPSNGASQPRQGWTIPKAALRSDDGKEAYSADQVIEIVDQKLAQARQEWQQGLQPLSQRFDQMDEREAVIQTIHESRQEAAEIMAEMRTLPHFTKENEPKIAKILESLPAQLKQRVGPIGALQIAYNKFLQKEVWPTIDQQAEQRVSARMKQKAQAAAGQVTPSGQTVTPPAKKPRTPDELARHMAAMAAQQGS